MATLTRQRQVGGKKEATEGTKETLAAADFAMNIKGNPSFEIDSPAYERELSKASLSKDAVLKAVRSVTIRATVELAGGAANTAAAWHDLLECCGLSKTQMKVVDIGAPSGGSFVPGDIIGNNATFASATKTGIFIAYKDASPDRLVYIPVTGTLADSDTVYNYASPQVSAAVDSAPANAGWAFRPASETAAFTPASGTVEVRDGEQVYRAFGARGKVKFDIRHNQPVLMEFEFMGPLDTASDAIPDVGFMTGITLPAATPVMGKNFPTFVDAYAPIFTQVSIDINNTLAKRADCNEIGGGNESGYRPTRITDRDIVIETDPEHPPIASENWLEKSLIGTTQRMHVRAGPLTAGAAAGTVVIVVPKVQITGNVNVGDRDGVVTNELNMRACFNGSGDDELIIAHVFI